jgi:hypothetical protein
MRRSDREPNWEPNGCADPNPTPMSTVGSACGRRRCTSRLLSLVRHLLQNDVCKQGVTGSSPVGSTPSQHAVSGYRRALPGARCGSKLQQRSLSLPLNSSRLPNFDSTSRGAGGCHMRVDVHRHCDLAVPQDPHRHPRVSSSTSSEAHVGRVEGTGTTGTAAAAARSLNLRWKFRGSIAARTRSTERGRCHATPGLPPASSRWLTPGAR